jgi:hypothetical protein
VRVVGFGVRGARQRGVEPVAQLQADDDPGQQDCQLSGHHHRGDVHRLQVRQHPAHEQE